MGLPAPEENPPNKNNGVNDANNEMKIVQIDPTI